MTREPIVTGADCDAEGRLHLDMTSSQHRALCLARFGGQRVDVEVRPRKSRRSLRANAALHAGLHEWGASKDLSGAALTQWVEDVKDDLLALCFGYVVRQDIFSGEIIRRLVKPHTAALDVEDFSILFEAGVMKAAEDGHIWRLPEEFATTKGAA